MGVGTVVCISEIDFSTRAEDGLTGVLIWAGISSLRWFVGCRSFI